METAMQAFVFVLCICFYRLTIQQRCFPRDFGRSSVVCLCNASVCDTAPQTHDLLDNVLVAIVVSDLSGKRLYPQSSNNCSTSRSDRIPIIVVDRTKRKQTVLGFGAALTDSAAINIFKMNEATQKQLLDTYFGKYGIGYILLRIPIGGTDFSKRPYTYADDCPSYDVNECFQLADEDVLYKIPIIKMIRSYVHDLKIFASPWSSPSWMKTNYKLNGSGFLKTQFYFQWAEYFALFLNDYRNHGIDLWAITTQNEPTNALIPRFPFNNLGWLPSDQFDWIKNFLKPNLIKSNNRDVKIIVMDDNRFVLSYWIRELSKSFNVSSMIDGVAVHWYWDTIFLPYSLDYVHNLYPSKFLLMTEACQGVFWRQSESVSLGNWLRAEEYVSDIIENLNHWVVGWVDWNLILDINGGPNWVSNFADASIIVDSSFNCFYKQPMFYAIAHFSTYIRPGYIILEHTEGIDLEHLITISPDNTIIVVVILNRREVQRKVYVDYDSERLLVCLQSKSFTTVILRSV